MQTLMMCSVCRDDDTSSESVRRQIDASCVVANQACVYCDCDADAETGLSIQSGNLILMQPAEADC